MSATEKLDNPPIALRILMISPQFRPIIGGYERACERLSAALTARGHSLAVVAERRNRNWPAKEVQDGFQVRRLWCIYRRRLHMPTALLAFVWFLITEGRKFDVWHVHQYGIHALIVLIFSKVFRRPVVLKLTNSGNQGLGKVASELPMPALSKYILRKADAVVALTRETRAEALSFGLPPERVHVIGNGVDIERYKSVSGPDRQRLRMKLGLKAKGVILFVGRLENAKNPGGLIKAWEGASVYLDDGWKLVFVGDGPLRADLESMVRSKNLQKSVLFAGQQSNIEEWMASADIYVLPSNNEGLSNSLLEAMACGLPVVATKVSGCSELVEETVAGIVTGIGNMVQLSAGIIKLAMDSETCIRFGRNSRSTIEKKFSLKTVAAQYESLYFVLV